ncbi:MAG: Crp/Fnr family transcriptional regulator [Olsenella sp.]|nr:Crp/Fnr family transcriptional regulator [Olsenella sp.]MCI1794152.1 Crp/Fnr family transcriptional regulator [Olsenella sp.]MCI1812040.1 Crp/Fnr family transcriptional regulator [Olsenella sp.]
MEEHLCVSFVPLFSDLSTGEQREIMKLAHHRMYEKGELIFQPGDERLDIVAQGSMKVYQLSPAGKEQLLRVVESGGYEGEKQLFGIANETLFGQALEQTKVCTLSKRAFNQVILCNPEISLKLFELTAQKMVQVENQAKFLSMERVGERLADYLLGLAKVEGDDRITLPMRVMDIAEYLGTTPETLSRKLKYLEEAGYIERAGRKITLLDRDALQDL